jgi:hypothetical protein
VATVSGTECEGILDLDGAFRGAKCSCSYFYKNRLRAGPCRHLLALRMQAMEGPPPPQAAPASVDARQPIVLHLPEPIVIAMKQEAKRRGVALSDLAEQAWKIARSRVELAARIDDLSADITGTPYRSSAKVQETLTLTHASERELQRQAARLDATVSQVFAGAWHVAYDVMRLTTSLLS